MGREGGGEEGRGWLFGPCQRPQRLYKTVERNEKMKKNSHSLKGFAQK